MKFKAPLRNALSRSLDEFRLYTARPDALIQISILGLLTGSLAGLLAVGFLLIIDYSLEHLIGFANPENFEQLSTWSRFLFPVIGALIIAQLFKWITKGEYVVGIVHVMERMAYHQAQLKLRAFFAQFIGGTIALISGQSLGREGPSVHLGAAVGSGIGHTLQLPNNTMRTLAACGTSAAIAASFNTPLAGVIFAMEIIMAEYAVASFIPIMIAAVAATGIRRLALGTDPTFTVSGLTSISPWEGLFIILLGVIIGLTSTVFTTLIRQTATRVKTLSITQRFLIGGVITGLLGSQIPQILGIGYDTVNHAILGTLGVSTLLAILAAKVIATGCSVGVGLPAGLIGPSLYIGAITGSAIGLTFNELLGENVAHPSVYAIVGMSAMMAACLQAPLAALTAVFELTANPHIVWPSMVAIVIAQLISKQIFKQPPVFELLLQLRGLDYHQDPLVQSLRKIGISSAMNNSTSEVDHLISPADAKEIFANNTPQWLVVKNDGALDSLLPSVDLATYLEEHNGEDPIDLLEIPGKRLQVGNIDIRATLDVAREQFAQGGIEALCIMGWTARGERSTQGILTKESFENVYMH